MLKRGLIAGAVTVLVCVVVIATNTKLQDRILTQLVSERLQAGHSLPVDEDSLTVFVCGSSSPVTVPNRAKACIGVLTEDDLLLFDVGPGAWKNIELWRLPTTKLSAVFLTHLHSDHIGDLAEANTQSWIWGRRAQLQVFGPRGTDELVAGLNRAYGPDAQVRFNQASKELLERNSATMQVQVVDATPELTPVYSKGDLLIEAFAVNHQLSLPALGYRVRYGDRVVVISGDTAYSENLVRHSNSVDLLIHEAVSERMLGIFIEAVNRSDDERMKKFAPRFGEAHTTIREITEISDRANVNKVALYHLLPPPNGAMAERMFAPDLPENFVISNDGMYFVLQTGTNTVVQGSL